MLRLILSACENGLSKVGRHNVPQMFVGEHHVGGFDYMIALEHAGSRDALLG